jgi:hypothetical protein
VSEEPIYIGAMHVNLIIPGARTRKDKRQVVRSLTDKVKSRFDVSCHLLGEGEHPGRQRMVLTTGGKSLSQVKHLFDKIRSFLDTFGLAWPGTIDVETFSWHPTDAPMERFHV